MRPFLRDHKNLELLRKSLYASPYIFIFITSLDLERLDVSLVARDFYSSYMRWGL